VQIRLDHGAPVVAREVGDRLEDADAGVVDEQVEPAVRALDVGEQRGHLPLVAHVARDPARAVPDLARRLPRRLRLTCRDHDRRALTGQRLDHGASNPAIPARHHRHLAIQPAHVTS
jgi:hypothetical protein